MLKKLNKTGDTIIEVLVSVAVLSLILTTSFTLANRSSKVTRSAAERAEASKYAQSEIEKLKYLLSGSSSSVGNPGDLFCIKSDNSIVSSGISVANVDSQHSSSSVDPSCRHGTENRYATFIYRHSSPDSNTYTAYVRWDSVTGRGVDKIDLVYRVYPGLISYNYGNSIFISSTARNL